MLPFLRSSLLSLALATSLVVGFSPLSALAIEYGGIGGRPAYPRPDSPRSDSIFIHTVEPGQVIEEAVTVINNSPETKSLLIYAADSTPSTGGGFACKQLLEEQTEVGTWIKLAISEVTLESQTNQVVPFTIEIPTNAGVGEHNGCILIQEKSAAKDGQQSGMQLSLRTGLRVALTVAGELKRELRLISFAAGTATDGGVRYTVQLANEGNVSTDARVAVVTTSMFGKTIYTHGGTYPILRDEESTFTFDLPQRFWGGWYTADLTVDYPKTVDPKGPQAHITGQALRVFCWPSWAAILLIVGVTLFIIGLISWIMILRKRKKTMQTTWQSFRVKTSIPIQDLAKKLGMSWKALAKANNLKAPYSIRAGDTLRLPPSAVRHTKTRNKKT